MTDARVTEEGRLLCRKRDGVSTDGCQGARSLFGEYQPKALREAERTARDEKGKAGSDSGVVTAPPEESSPPDIAGGVG